MIKILEKIYLTGIVPVIKIDDVDKAVPLAKALCKGGIPVAEITFRTEQGEEAIKRISQEIPEMLVGAGTVLNIEQVDKAINAGASFVVSPGFNPAVVQYCIDQDIIILPGCNNPSDVERAITLGLNVVKFFPAEASGGIAMIKALAGPYGNMRFMPTGGIDKGNLNDYLSFSKVLACGGSWMVPDKLIQEGNFEKITSLAEEAVSHMLGFRLAHIGINQPDENQASQTASIFSNLFNLGLEYGSNSIFAGSIIELMHVPYKGAHGHIAIKTNYIDRAIHFLKNKGYTFDETTAKYDEKNTLKSIYLNEEIAGYAIHLV